MSDPLNKNKKISSNFPMMMSLSPSKSNNKKKMQLSSMSSEIPNKIPYFSVYKKTPMPIQKSSKKRKEERFLKRLNNLTLPKRNNLKKP